MSDDQRAWMSAELHLLPAAARGAQVLIGFPTTLPLLIGREVEVRAVMEVLQQATCRLLTLTGPGGMGKTRLALAIAAEVAGDYADGVVFIPLEAIRDPAAVVPAIAMALNVREAPGRSLREILSHALRDREHLLVLDNFEHVASAAADVAYLLEGSPGLKVLVTSRVPLRVQIEQRFPTPPLGLPSGEHTATADLLAYDAIALFAERSRRARPDFQLTSENAADVIALVQHLEGIPLAIELAAAWSHVLPPHTLRDRLARRLDVLSGGPADQPPRLQSMREAIAWSYDLLTEAERRLFCRLGIFVGGFRLDAAEVVGASISPDLIARPNQGSLQVLPVLARLVEASLVQRVSTDAQEPRYRLLETVREFALEQLHASGEYDHVALRHARWFRDLVEASEPDLLGPEETRAQETLHIELGNLRAALTWSVAQDPQIAVCISGLLWVFWIYYGLIGEGYQWIISALHTKTGTAQQRANAMVTAAALATMQADTARAAPLVLQATMLASRLENPVVQARLSFVRGAISLELRRAEEAARHLEQAVILYDTSSAPTDRVMRAWSRASQGVALAGARDFPAAVASFELAQQDVVRTGSRFVEALILCDFAGLLLDIGETARAKDMMTEVMRIATELQQIGQLGEAWLVSQSLFVMAAIDVREHNHARAARSMGAAAAIMNRMGLVFPPPLQARADQTLLQLSVALRSDAAKMLQEGKANPSATVADLLQLRFSLSAEGVGEGVARKGPLSARERQILMGIAAGQSDRQIAEALFISRKTVSNHVTNILQKLEVQTRAAAVARAVSEQVITTS